MLIEAGRVTVDGAPAHIGQKADPDTVVIEIDGIPLPVDPDLAYYLVYKPTGVVSTADDPGNRPTVIQLVEADARLYPVGRLDSDTEGLLILTNDGDLTMRLTHPRYGVPKTYVALVEGRISDTAVQRLRDGVDLDDGPASALAARVVDRHGDGSLVEVVMGEGRNRIVRRLLAAVGHPVRSLTRTAIGPLRDGKLEPGTSRQLTIEEVRSLYAAADPDPGK